ncbi:4-acetamidobutyryl-CoA deacetylase [Mesobacillus persicus]|uniref:4-acetamidobutyryl-CoA deacetylase n=1 Tax=Mesobacillus persicus TaxID=930146 RepID=A0A1H8BEM0_9BACI|nr:peptidase [Mesobacillus persicus]SEM81252.1 4-acetamidobutyryl-CoA deacetylase [Mesobacillus persicus]
MEEAQRKVRAYIQGNQSDAAKFLQRVVQEGSVRGKESSAQAVIIEKCRELGMNMDIWELGGEELTNHPAFCSDRNNFVGNPNAVGVLPGTGGGRSLILNGHIDVVPVGDIDSWEYEPFSGKIENGRLYGRGSTDMKGGTVSLLLALEAIIKSGVTLKGDVIFQSVIEEESGGAGTLSTVLRGYKADGAIIPEPTNLKFFPKQQGSMWFRIKIRGKQAHGGTRYEGVSAIEKAELILKEIRELEIKRNSRITDPLFSEIPIPIPINVGKISSGDWPSSVPDIALIEGRMGVAPDESMENAKQEMEQAIEKVASLDPWLKENQPVVEWFGARWLPGDIEVEHDLVTVLTESFTEIKRARPVIEASPWATDGGILNKIGGVPVVVFGPGVTKMAHDANEYIELNDVYEVAEIIAVAIMKWCGTENDGT